MKEYTPIEINNILKREAEIVSYMQNTEQELRRVCTSLEGETNYRYIKESYNAMHGLIANIMLDLKISTID